MKKKARLISLTLVMLVGVVIAVFGYYKWRHAKVEEILSEVLPLYHEIQVLTSSPDLNVNAKTPVTIKDHVYFEVLDQRYSNTGDIEDKLQQLYTSNCINEHFDYLFHGDAPLYLDYDGAFYLLMADAPISMLDQKSFKINKFSKDKISVYIKYLDPDSPDCCVELCLVYKMNRWFIDDFDYAPEID